MVVMITNTSAYHPISTGILMFYTAFLGSAPALYLFQNKRGKILEDLPFRARALAELLFVCSTPRLRRAVGRRLNLHLPVPMSMSMSMSFPGTGAGGQTNGCLFFLIANTAVFGSFICSWLC
ncbi:hypothetical protein DFP73DRAFT_549193 [Morchella snyderi]|nr:hypothetical protein DFP73DRAFT_549193 [Morchella snyderi]